MAGFDLGAMLASVSDSDTGREQIEYIPLADLESDPNNFYQLSHLDELADNIATCGLQQPLRVRPDPDRNGKYIIVSGHRRRAAVAILAKENMEKWREVPCIVERDSVSPALQQLRLIYANANTRAMTSAEISQQAEQVEKLLYGFNTSNATALCAVADLLHCSVDYLLGRSSDPEQSTPWHTGKPWNIGEYVVLVRYSPECSACVATVHWDGAYWWEDGTPLEDMGAEILLWTDMPEVE